MLVEKTTDEKGKQIIIFTDPLYEGVATESIVTFCSIVGDWQVKIETEKRDSGEEYVISLFPRNAGALRLGFKTHKDRTEFANSVFTVESIRQLEGGVNIEGIINSKMLEKQPSVFSKLKKQKRKDEKRKSLRSINPAVRSY